MNSKIEIEIKIIKILDELEKIYNNETHPPILKHDEPLDGLILIILSQNTNDKNRDVAFKNLKSEFKNYDEIIAAGACELERVIKYAGLARTKSIRIINILEIIKKDFGEYSLKKLKFRDKNYIWNYLINLKGVGAKTANCVLLFDFGLAAFPVDTHITRITKRTGISEKNLTPDEISVMLEKIIPKKRFLGGHINLIEHGRRICKAKKPLCEECKINWCCDYFNLL